MKALSTAAVVATICVCTLGIHITVIFTTHAFIYVCKRTRI